jgi:hypothetical protein
VVKKSSQNTTKLGDSSAKSAELKQSVDELKTLVNALSRKLDGGGQ